MKKCNEWKVRTMYVGYEKIYQIYKLINMSSPDIPSNRNVRNHFYRDEQTAIAEAKLLNYCSKTNRV